jgi:cytoskeletal protein RodZ
MDVGSTLRAARERQGLTIAQLASTTKIPVGILQALEENAFERVPRGIFVRGFLRAYASEVGLDPADIVARYLQESGQVQPATDLAAEHAAIEDDDLEPTPIDADLRPAAPGWSYLAIIAALLVAFIGVSRYNEEAGFDGASTATLSDDAMDAAPLQGESVATAAAVRPVATAGRSLDATADGVAHRASTLQFTLQADEECWVEAVVDGRRLVYRLMQPGERTTIESDREIVLRVGDPGALTYFVNGTPGKPLGRAGVPITVRFTNQGV